MPQMSPLNWLSMYMLFTLLFILSVIINYYMFLYTPKMQIKAVEKKTINWKW
uniref:ATP synthase complex subunit 8 n=1 Tax=Elaeidobius kamerunicus TaxID=2663966 RepID=A0A7D5YCB1_9CUCU|nr:ATP synthase F0 subunit 8 [Elaeidobius kamerunicus]QLI52332.1 ATP synthase subunit 8 [Elaeidobius kamerunicus]